MANQLATEPLSGNEQQADRMISQADIQSLKDYVAADSGVQNRAESTVLLQVSHSNLRARFMEIRLDLHVSF